jgi:hypothetical protein
MDNTSEVRGTKLSEALQIQELLCYFKNVKYKIECILQIQESSCLFNR